MSKYVECPSIPELRPKESPLGDGHHTDEPFSAEDDKLGNFLAWHLGCLFSDENCPNSGWFYHTMTSVEEWRRVSRALRIHGLKIATDGGSGG
jgi:hypothetical protein